MPSYPGQDTGYVPAKEKTMIFIPSTGGSHDPAENAKPKDIETATKVFTNFSENLLLENIRDRLVLPSSSNETPYSGIPSGPSISIDKNILDRQN